MAGIGSQGDASTGFEDHTKGNAAASKQDGTQARETLSLAAFSQTSDLAPSSDLDRYSTWLGDGVKDLPVGLWHSVQRDFGSWEGLKGTGEMLLSSAALGAALKIALPEGGVAGKIASLAIGGYFMRKAAAPVLDSYHKAHDAQTMSQLHAAGSQLGEVAADFGVSTVISAGGYKLGSAGTGRVLETEAFDNFAASKARFWHPTETFLANHTPDWLAGRLITQEAVQRARTIDLNTRSWAVKGNTATLLDSMRDEAPGTNMGPIDPNAKINVSVYAKSLDETGIKLDRRLQRIGKGTAGFVSDREMATKFGGDPESMAQIQKWAQSKGLNVELQDARTARMVISGTGAQVEAALGTKLELWKAPDGTIHRARTGALNVDAGVAPYIDSILGADNRPHVRTLRTPFVPLEDLKAAEHGTLAHEAAGPGVRPQPVLASDLARARGLTVDENTGKGKTVGIGELGGDIDLDQDATFYTKRGLPVPERIKKGVNGTVPKSDGPNGADGEVALDTNNVGLVAPGAKQVIAFGENSDAGFPDTQNELAFPTDGAPAADQISWSWGQRQGEWTKQAQSSLVNALKRSAAKGVTTFVASGDNGAADGAPKGFDVDFPSASPYLTSVGGTQVVLSGGKVIYETAWNDGPRGGQTGGGISNETPRPDFQKGLKMPANANGNGFDGRGDPDVSENASPKSGYIVQVDGQEGAIGGTSGAAPQWAAYAAALTAQIGRNLGNLNYFLYKNGTAGLFNDITTGDNRGYKSGPGWDAVTGWGTPIILNILDALKKDAAGTSKIRPLFPALVNDQQRSNNQKAG